METGNGCARESRFGSFFSNRKLQTLPPVLRQFNVRQLLTAQQCVFKANCVALSVRPDMNYIFQAITETTLVYAADLVDHDAFLTAPYKFTCLLANNYAKASTSHAPGVTIVSRHNDGAVYRNCERHQFAPVVRQPLSRGTETKINRTVYQFPCENGREKIRATCVGLHYTPSEITTSFSNRPNLRKRRHVVSPESTGKMTHNCTVHMCRL